MVLLLRCCLAEQILPPQQDIPVFALLQRAGSACNHTSSKRSMPALHWRRIGGQARHAPLPEVVFFIFSGILPIKIVAHSLVSCASRKKRACRRFLSPQSIATDFKRNSPKGQRSDNFFHRPAAYGYADDVMRYASFSKAALEYMLKANKHPDVIRCHDWQTAVIPVLLYEIYKFHGLEKQRVCLTIHNFGHQGMVGDELLWAAGLGRPECYFQPDRLQDNTYPGSLNLLKGGIVYSNFVTIVSRHHAWEAMNTHQGLALSHTLWIHQNKFGGIHNGIDYDVWNPEIDPFIARRYTPDSLDLKYENKGALRQRFWLRDGYKPIVAYVGRLDNQKGISQPLSPSPPDSPFIRNPEACRPSQQDGKTVIFARL